MQDITIKPDELREWIEDIIDEEIIPLLEARHTLKSLMSILNKNLDKSADLRTAVQYSYVSALVLAICRQTDCDPRTKNLARLLRLVVWEKSSTTDLCVLLCKTKELRKYRDKRIAHRDNKDYELTLTFNDVDEAIDLIVSLSEKYYEKLTGNGTKLRVTVDEDWQELFIATGNSEPA